MSTWMKYRVIRCRLTWIYYYLDPMKWNCNILWKLEHWMPGMLEVAHSNSRAGVLIWFSNGRSRFARAAGLLSRRRLGHRVVLSYSTWRRNATQRPRKNRLVLDHITKFFLFFCIEKRLRQKNVMSNRWHDDTESFCHEETETNAAGKRAQPQYCARERQKSQRGWEGSVLNRSCDKSRTCVL